jgi:hypothetical protein
LHAWQSSADASRHTRVAFHVDALPQGQVQLQMSGPGGEPSDTRLIEIRPATD